MAGEPPKEATKALCRGCGYERALRGDGTIWAHRAPGTRRECRGSRRPPEPADGGIMRRAPRPVDGVLGDVLHALEGARWHRWVGHARLLVIWRAARADDREVTTEDGQPVMEAALRVIDLDTGNEVEVWPIHPPAATGVVTERDAAAAVDARSIRGFV